LVIGNLGFEISFGADEILGYYSGLRPVDLLDIIVTHSSVASNK